MKKRLYRAGNELPYPHGRGGCDCPKRAAFMYFCRGEGRSGGPYAPREAVTAAKKASRDAGRPAPCGRAAGHGSGNALRRGGSDMAGREFLFRCIENAFSF